MNETVTSLLSREDFRILYLSYVHSIMTYGVIYYEHMGEFVLWPLLFYRIYYIMYI
jgi:trehalose-6-phosphate synthase